jgi:hypothetical protein
MGQAKRKKEKKLRGHEKERKRKGDKLNQEFPNL